ncbi:thiamine phosphate synthase [Chryseobacterium salviniae]|uniref:Thiamine phosphate synthase n=1 Tax=Chryseobacterium salviniae TaxID=3101750 RepID=A0ABU6HWH2_9FLAO|nr:thiamine phosphate synthase [Chryseobacterium sp. T9W2-O]MEC3877426.1 thiamine phosphate synthase [Chryseobacterium sp. T9W2-O]
MIIIITSEKEIYNESKIINELFQEGLDLLHIRKPLMSSDVMKDFIKSIDVEFHQRLVLHSHYDVANYFNISGFHFREIDRQNNIHEFFIDKIISTSVHDIQTFNKLKVKWNYAFISPVFQSISKKGYGKGSNILNDIKKRDNQNAKLIALGGIHENNINEVLKSNVDGVALLGAIWENNQPVEIFKKCRKNILS